MHGQIETPRLIFHNDPANLREFVADRLAEHLVGAVRKRGFGSFSIGGGSFVPMFLETLKRCHLDWSRIRVVMGDERFVPLDHPDSNEGNTRRALGSRICSEAQITGLRGSAATAEQSVCDAETRIRDALTTPLDAVLLGLGPDGHTASLFPSAAPEELRRALSPADGRLVTIVDPKVFPYRRLTLTVPALLRTREIWLHLPSAEKTRVFFAALKPGRVQQMPVRAILRQHSVPVHVHLLAAG